MQCSAVRIHRLDRLHGLSCRQAGDGNRHGLAQSRLCRRAQGCFLPVRHLDRIGLARGCAVDLPEFHVVDLHGGVSGRFAIKCDINFSIRNFYFCGKLLIDAIKRDVDHCLLRAIITRQLHAAGICRRIRHFYRRIHTVDPIRQSCNRLAEPAFIGASIIEIEFIVAAKRIVFIYAMAGCPRKVFYRPVVQDSVFEPAIRNRQLYHYHGFPAHFDTVNIDVCRIAFVYKNRQRIFSFLEMDGHWNFIPEAEILHIREKYLLGIRTVICIDAHRLRIARAICIPQIHGIVALFRDGNTGETHPIAHVVEPRHVSGAFITAEDVFTLCIPHDLCVFCLKFKRRNRRPTQGDGGSLRRIRHLHITDFTSHIGIIAGFRCLEGFQGIVRCEFLPILLDGYVFICRLMELHQIAARRNIRITTSALANLECDRRIFFASSNIASIRSGGIHAFLIGIRFAVILIEDKIKASVLQRREHVQCQNIDRFFADIFHFWLHRYDGTRFDKDREQRNRRGIL